MCGVRGAGRGKTGRVAGAPLELPLATQPHGDAPSPAAPSSREGHTHLERLGGRLEGLERDLERVR